MLNCVLSSFLNSYKFLRFLPECTILCSKIMVLSQYRLEWSSQSGLIWVWTTLKLHQLSIRVGSEFRHSVPPENLKFLACLRNQQPKRKLARFQLHWTTQHHLFDVLAFINHRLNQMSIQLERFVCSTTQKVSSLGGWVGWGGMVGGGWIERAHPGLVVQDGQEILWPYDCNLT